MKNISGKMPASKILEHWEPPELTKPTDMFRVAGIDLGTNCGVAWIDVPKTGKALSACTIFAGLLELTPGAYDTGPLRFLRFEVFLDNLRPDLIGFEDVKYTPPADTFGNKALGIIIARVATAAEVLGGLKVTLTTWAEKRGIPAQGVGIGQIKRYATGKGNAGKEDMIHAANKAYGVKLDAVNYKNTKDDNIADAMHVCMMLAEAYAIAR